MNMCIYTVGHLVRFATRAGNELPLNDEYISLQIALNEIIPGWYREPGKTKLSDLCFGEDTEKLEEAIKNYRGTFQQDSLISSII